MHPHLITMQTNSYCH